MVTITEKAAGEISRSMTDNKVDQSSTFLRIGISAGGCSGFQYKLVFDNQKDDEMDTEYEVHGVKFVVDKRSALYLDGATLDYHESIDKRGFVFDNPNVVKSCGCGSSFQA